jgi:two-component system, response regulator PdtaR
MSNPAEDAVERRRSILVVKDELFIGLELKACLEDAGFLVLGPAGSVRDALRLISTQLPNAAVLDLNLGGENVVPVVERLNLLDVPYVMASAGDNAELARYTALAGACNIGKPTDLKVLVNTMLALTA